MGDAGRLSKCTGKDGKVYDIEEIYEAVRNLLQDDNLAEDNLIEFMRSESFAAICPELHEAFNTSERLAREQANKIKKEKLEGAEKLGENSKVAGKIKEEKVDKSVTEKLKTVKQEPIDKVDSHHDRRKQKLRVRSISSDSSSDDEKRPVRKEEVKKKKKKKHHRVKTVVVSDSDSSSSSNVDIKPAIKQHKPDKNVVPCKPAKAPQESQPGPKVHPFWLGQQGSAIQPKGKLFNNEDKTEENEKKKKRRQHEESTRRKRQHEEIAPKKKVQPVVREPKPYSYYRKQSAVVAKKVGWRPPQLDKEFTKLQKKHNLKPMSVLCVDLLKLNTHFHHPAKGPPSSTTSIPLKRNMHISDSKGDAIVDAETVKRDSYKPVLNKLFRNHVAECKRRASRDDVSSLDDETSRKKHHAHRRVVESSSDSSSSDPVVPKKGMNQVRRDRRQEKINARKGSADYKAEQRKRQLDQIKAKNEKYSSKGTRQLPWESKEYFERRKAAQAKKDEPLTAKQKEKKRLDDKLKFMKKPNAPSTSIQKILSQIEAANKEAAKKPPVALKIPKLSERSSELRKPTTRVILPSELRSEVELLLESNTKIEMPVMTSSNAELSEYTIRKMAWWYLKNEKEQADDVIFHPELHDSEIMEPGFVPRDDGFDSDTSSIGCVSDPEGVNKLQVNEITSTNIDGDVADEYCGLGSLQALIRRMSDKPDAPETMKAFFKVRPGTNYEKRNFEAKCFLCEDKVVGQRELGAHIRSERHKNQFRNYSLKLASYEEQCFPAENQKYFKARLVEYTTEKPDLAEPQEEKPRKVEVEIQPSDSPRAVIDGEDESQELVAVNDLPTDQLSLPSLTLFDLQVDQEQLQAKFILKRANKWTERMEVEWTKMLVEEARITEKYNDTREQYINAPNSHPLHDEEWMKFWNRRCDEFEAEGKNPDDHDFSNEWEAFWFKRMQEIMKSDVEKEIAKLKSSFQLDFASLLKLIEKNGLKFEAGNMVKSKETKSVASKENSHNKMDSDRENLNPQKTETPKSIQKNNFTPQNAETRTIHTHNRHPVIQSPVEKESPNIIDKLLQMAAPTGQSMEPREPKNELKIKTNESEEDWETHGNFPTDAVVLPTPSNPVKSESKKKEETINLDCRKSEEAPKVNESLDNPPTTKKLPVAPPPPKISQSYSKHETERRHAETHKDSRNKSYSRDEKSSNSRRENKDERRDRDRDRSRALRDDKRDLLDVIREEKRDGKRKLSPDGGRARHSSRDYRSDRKRNRRSPSKERVDDQRKEYQTLRNSDSGSERDEPNAKKSKDASIDVNGCREIKHEPDSKDQISSPTQAAHFSVTENTAGTPKDINVLLQELEAAKQLVEFVEKVPIAENLYLPDKLGLGDVEKISDGEAIDFDSPESPVNTSVVMEENDNFGASPINTSVEMEPDNEPVINTNIQTQKIEKKARISASEEGEIGSGSSSVSMGFKLNQTSTFIPNMVRESGKLSGPKRKSKCTVNTDVLDASDVSSGPVVNVSSAPPASEIPFIPLPGELNRNSIGYHLYINTKEPGEIEDVTPPSSPKPSRRRKKHRGRNSHDNNRRNSREWSQGSTLVPDNSSGREPYGEDPFEILENQDAPRRRSSKSNRKESPPRRLSKNQMRREARQRRELSSPSDLKISQGLPSAPGPKCSKPTWARDEQRYQPLPPPPPPPRLQPEWKERSWKTEDSPRQTYRNEGNWSSYRNQKAVPQQEEEEEEDWEAEEYTVETVAPPAHLKLKTSTTTKTEKEDETPYSPAWDEDSNDRLVEKPSENVFLEPPASPTPPTPTYSGGSKQKPLLPSPGGVRNPLPLTGSNTIPVTPVQYYNNNIGVIGDPVVAPYAQNMYQNVANQDWNNSMVGGNSFANPGLNQAMINPNQQMYQNPGAQQQRYPPPNPYQQNYGNWNTW